MADPAYMEVASRVSSLIETGVFAVGERIPSVRTLSERLGNSPATVFAAYRKLALEGRIEARPQSGYYVCADLRRLAPTPQIGPVKTSSTRVTTSEITRQLIETGHRSNVIALDGATPAADLLPTLALARALARGARRHPALATTYAIPPGLAVLRKAIAVRSVDGGAYVSPNDVVVTTGATEALILSLRAVAKPGDVIAVESPTYYGVLLAIESLGMRVVEVETSPQHGLSLPHLSETLARRRIAACVAMPNFNNPLGSAMPDEAKRELVETLGRAGVPLIEDDVAGDLAFDRKRSRSAKSFDQNGMVLLCSSVSKVLAPGFRVGWVLPGRFRDRVIQEQWSNTIAASAPAQLGIAEFWGSGAYDRHVQGMRTTVSETMRKTSESIRQHFPEGTAVTRPRGGLVLWVALPAGIDSLALHAVALKAGVAIMPGALFSPRPVFANCIRISCASRWVPSVERALAVVGQLATHLCGLTAKKTRRRATAPHA